MASDPEQRPRFRGSLTRDWLVIAVLMLAMLATAGYLDLFGRVDRMFYDATARLWWRAASDRVTIVAVDDDSLEGIGRWPWPRGVHARVLETVSAARPAAIGLDLILAEPDPDPRADAALARAVRDAGNVVLPVYAERIAGGMHEIRPVPIFQEVAADLAHIHAELDGDGMLRRVFLYEGVGGATREHLSLSLVRIAAPAAAARFDRAGEPRGEASQRIARPVSSGVRKPRADSLVRDVPYLVPYAGAVGHLLRVSYVDVLLGRVPKEAFADRIVLFGAVAAGLGDTYPTPVSAEGVAMPGVEVTANAIAGMLDGIVVREADWLPTAVVAWLIVLVVLMLLLWSPPRQAPWIWIGAMLLVVPASLWILHGASIWMSPASALFGVALTYPLWSWRRLEAANRFLVRETGRMARTIRQWPMPGVSPITTPDRRVLADSFEVDLDLARQVSDAVHNVNQVFGQSIAGLPVAVVVCDREHRVLLANPLAAELSGEPVPADTQELLAFLGRVRPACQRPWGEIVDEVVSGRGTQRGEATAADDREFLMQVAPYAMVEGVVLGAVITLVEVSDLKRLQREQKDFIDFVSHDIRSPQNSILALVELARGADDPDDRQRYWDRVEGYASRTLELIEAMLNQARADRLAPESFQELDANELVADVFDQAWPLARRRDQRILLALGDRGPRVAADRETLHRAVLNLLDNAIKYSPAGSTIRLDVVAVGSAHVELRVTDEGPGIAPEHLDRLFNRFQRVPQAADRDPGGLGLGLAFTRTVAHKLGGEVGVTTKPGQGATFFIRLPLSN